MGVRERLVGSRRRTAATAVGAVVLVVVVALLAGVVGVPSVVAAENRFGAVNESTTVVGTELTVRNPNPVGVSRGGTTVNYTVRMNDVAIAEGRRDGLSVPRGESTVPFTTVMDNERIPEWWVSHVSADRGPGREQTVVTVDARVTDPLLGGRSVTLQQRQRVNTSIIEQFRSTEDRPVNAGLPVVSDPVLVVRETDAQWGTVTRERTPIDTRFLVYNPKPVPYAVTEIGYEVTMNGVRVGAGTTERGYVVPPRGTETVRTTTAIRNGRLDDWWVTHLRNGQVTRLEIDFYARIELPSGRVVRVPLEPLTYERTIETDVFGNEEATTATATPTDATATTTAPTETTAPTPTTTTDEGLLETTDRVTAPGTTTDNGLLNTTDVL